MRVSSGVILTAAWMAAAWWGTKSPIRLAEVPPTASLAAPADMGEPATGADPWETALDVVQKRAPEKASAARTSLQNFREAAQETGLSTDMTIEVKQTPLMKAFTRVDPSKDVTPRKAWEKIVTHLSDRRGKITRIISVAALLFAVLSVIAFLSENMGMAASVTETAYFGAISTLWVQGGIAWTLKFGDLGNYFSEVPPALWAGPAAIFSFSALGSGRIAISITQRKKSPAPPAEQTPFDSTVLGDENKEPWLDRFLEKWLG